MLAQRRRELLGILCMRHVVPLLKGKTQDGSKEAQLVALEQRSANYNPRAEFSTPPAFT